MIAQAIVDPGQLLSDYGVLGAVVISFIMGWLVPGWIYKRTLDSLEALEKQFATEVIPALTRCADALKALTGPGQGEE